MICDNNYLLPRPLKDIDSTAARALKDVASGKSLFLIYTSVKQPASNLSNSLLVLECQRLNVELFFACVKGSVEFCRYLRQYLTFLFAKLGPCETAWRSTSIPPSFLLTSPSQNNYLHIDNYLTYFTFYPSYGAQKCGIVDVFGTDNFFWSVHDAVEHYFT